MKLMAAILLIGALHVSASGIAQKVSISGKNVPLSVVFNSIEAQTGYGVIMSNDLWKGAKPVSVDFREATVDEVLEKCFEFQPWKLEYTVIGRSIVISKDDRTLPTDNGVGPVKTVKVEVTVYNEAGEPLSGANVTVKEIRKGTFTNARGECTLAAVQLNSTLVVSFVGYAPQEVKIKEETNLKIYLKVAKNELDKVVIQAYGVTTQRLATGNIGTVTSEQIARQPIMNPLEALQGQIPGVVVTNTSGYASGTVKVEIRGRNTINPNFPSDPLYIIDGVPLTILDLRGTDSYSNGATGVIQAGVGSPAGGQSPFFNINPLDIESIEVLKDADATAIYGSRGANGVILITTKKGKPGKAHFDFNIYDGIAETPRYYKMLNTQQYVAMRKEALTNDGLPIDDNNAPDLVTWDTTRYTNWQKFLWGGLGKVTDAEASLAGGDAQTTYRIATAYRYQTEILASGGANKRGSISFNLGHRSLNQRFKVDFTGDYSITSNNIISLPGVITLPPDAPSIFDNKGNLNFAGWSPLDYTFPFGGLLQPYSSNTYLLNSSMVLSYQLLNGLVVKSNFGYNNIQTNQKNYFPIASQDPAYNPTGSNQFGFTFINNLIIEPQIELNHYLGKGKIDVLAGASAQTNSTSSAVLQGNGFTNDALLTSVNGAPSQVSGNYAGQYKYEGLFGRINYNLKDEYILNLNARRDGSSRFGPGRQFGNFGSVGANWIFSQEPLSKLLFPFLSFGKIRGSYGTTGGDQIGDYSYLSQWSFGVRTYNNTLPLNPLGHTDSTLHWQINRKLEGAIDLGFFKDYVNLEIAYYQNRCNDQLIEFPTPYFTGFNQVTANSPADVQNSGWEFLLTSKNIENANFRWSSKFNLGVNRNKLLSYPNLSQSPYADRYIVGQSLNIVKVLHFTGIDPETGLYTFQDKNHNGQVDIIYGNTSTDDRYPLDLSPKFDGSFTNTLDYKNWELSIMFYFKKQKGNNAYATLDAAGDMTNQPTTVLNRWQRPGDVTNTPRFTTNDFNGNLYNYFEQSDGVYTDASFIRLQNLTLSYSIPPKMLKGLKINNCTFFIKGQNLFIITKYQGLDPEVQSFGLLPLSRVITGGLSCSF